MIQPLSLMQRALLIVSIPIVFQLGFVFSLYALIWTVEGELLRESTKRQAATQTVSRFVRYLADPDPMQLINQDIKDNSLVDYLIKNGQLNQFEIKEILKARAAEENLKAVVNVINSRGQPGFDKFKRYRPDLVAATYQFTAACASVADVLNANSNDSLSRTGKETVVRFLWLAAAASIPVALVLAYLYAISILRPIRRIIDNSKRLSARQPLEPPLTGSDELARLDLLLHEVSKQINEAQAHQRSVLANAQALICTLDAGGKILTANPRALALIGIDDRDLIGKRLPELVFPEDREKAGKYLKECCSGTQAQEVDLRLTHKDGFLIETRWTCVWVPTEQTLFAVAHDVSEQNQIDRARQSFLKIMSQELRQPLRLILSEAEFLSSQLDVSKQDSPAGETMPAKSTKLTEIERIEANVRKLVEVVDELVVSVDATPETEGLDLQECDLDEIFAAAVDLVIDFARSREIDIIVPAQCPKIVADRNRLLQVVLNLLSNAVKFSPQKGAITIGLKPDGDWIEVTVVDEGPGIDEAIRRSIFEPFQQGDAQPDGIGLGLGLSICKRIIEGHGGLIGVRSITGSDTQKNCEFWFRLPTQLS